MMSVFQDSVFFGVLLSLASYSIGLALKIKTGWSFDESSFDIYRVGNCGSVDNRCQLLFV